MCNPATRVAGLESNLVDNVRTCEKRLRCPYPAGITGSITAGPTLKKQWFAGKYKAKMLISYGVHALSNTYW